MRRYDLPLPLKINRDLRKVLTYDQVPCWEMTGKPGRLLRDADGQWWSLLAYSVDTAEYAAVVGEPTRGQIEAFQ